MSFKVSFWKRFFRLIIAIAVAVCFTPLVALAVNTFTLNQTITTDNDDQPGHRFGGSNLTFEVNSGITYNRQGQNAISVFKNATDTSGATIIINSGATLSAYKATPSKSNAINAEDAIDFGVTGPSLRATGVLEDVRISEPYSIYDRFDYGIPVGTNGDCWDRYYVRVEEMRQSIRIIEQAMDQMVPGETMAKLRRIARPPKGESYVRTESPRGDFAVFVVSDGTEHPYRVKVRAPSFANLQALQHMLRDAYVADAVVILGSIDIVLGEVDR